MDHQLLIPSPQATLFHLDKSPALTHMRPALEDMYLTHTSQPATDMRLLLTVPFPPNQDQSHTLILRPAEVPPPDTPSLLRLKPTEAEKPSPTNTRPLPMVPLNKSLNRPRLLLTEAKSLMRPSPNQTVLFPL